MNSKTFKETEIGFIPVDWEIVNLQNYLKIPPNNGIYKSNEFQGKGIKLIKMDTLFDNYFINNQEMELLDLNQNEKEKFLVEDGDLIFARTSLVLEGIGKCALVEKINEEMAFESNTFRIRLNKKLINPKYILYFFRSDYGKNYLYSIANQTAATSIKSKDLTKLSLPIPKLTEQNEIVNLLYTLEKKIHINNQMNKKLEIIGRSIFDHWFVHFEFPNDVERPYKSSGGEMVDSELGEIPVGWEIKPLDEVAIYLNGLALQKYPQEDDDYLPVIKIRELKKGITEQTDKASCKIPEEYIIADGDIIFSWSGSLEVVIWGEGKGALNQHLFKVSSNEFPKWFYYYQTLRFLPSFRQTAADKATTMGHIKRQHLTESLVPVPNKEFLLIADMVLKPIIEQIINNKVQSRYLKSLKDIVLPKLMSGKIRVSIPAEGAVK